MKIPRVTPWDQRLFGRTLALSCLLAGVVWGVAAATDEPQSTWFDRLARLAALSPLVGGSAVSLVAAQGQRRGEWRTLATCGQSVLLTARGAILAAGMLGLFAAGFLALGRGSLRALFPTLTSSPWQRTAEGFTAPKLGMHWALDAAAVSFFPPVAPTPANVAARFWVAAMVTGSAWLVPCWVSLPCHAAMRLAVGAAAVGSALVAFHVAAVGAPAFWILLPAVIFAAHTWVLWQRSQRL